MLRRFTGSDAMRLTATVPAGSSPIEPGFAPASDVELAWATFTDAANQGGLSRRLGGIHFRDGDFAGRELGGRVGAQAWKKAAAHMLGTADSQVTTR